MTYVCTIISYEARPMKSEQSRLSSLMTYMYIIIKILIILINLIIKIFIINISDMKTVQADDNE